MKRREILKKIKCNRGLSEEEFWNNNVIIGDEQECWDWIGKYKRSLTGLFEIDGEDIGAHKLVYALYHGELRDNLTLYRNHECDTTLCVSPFHYTTKLKHSREDGVDSSMELIKMNKEELQAHSTRFWQSVRYVDGCWIWQGERQTRGHRNGKGRFNIGNGKRAESHRVAWVLCDKEDITNKHLEKVCETLFCVLPEHYKIKQYAWEKEDSDCETQITPRESVDIERVNKLLERGYAVQLVRTITRSDWDGVNVYLFGEGFPACDLEPYRQEIISLYGESDGVAILEGIHGRDHIVKIRHLY